MSFFVLSRFCLSLSPGVWDCSRLLPLVWFICVFQVSFALFTLFLRPRFCLSFDCPVLLYSRSLHSSSSSLPPPLSLPLSLSLSLSAVTAITLLCCPQRVNADVLSAVSLFSLLIYILRAAFRSAVWPLTCSVPSHTLARECVSSVAPPLLSLLSLSSLVAFVSDSLFPLTHSFIRLQNMVMHRCVCVYECVQRSDLTCARLQLCPPSPASCRRTPSLTSLPESMTASPASPSLKGRKGMEERKRGKRGRGHTYPIHTKKNAKERNASIDNEKRSPKTALKEGERAFRSP